MDLQENTKTIFPQNITYFLDIYNQPQIEKPIPIFSDLGVNPNPISLCKEYVHCASREISRKINFQTAENFPTQP